MHFDKLKNLFQMILDARKKGQYIHTNEGGDFALVRKGNVLHVLFEWSDGAEDWRNNLDFFAEPYKNMEEPFKAHRGFVRVWKAMRDGIEGYVKERIGEIERVIVAGYSHGAAMALLCVEDLEYCFGGQVEIEGYGFGTPRVLWGKVPQGVKNRLKNFTAIRNLDDLVTHVPPKILGFRDPENIVEIGKKGQYNGISAHLDAKYTESLDIAAEKEYNKGKGDGENGT